MKKDVLMEWDWIHERAASCRCAFGLKSRLEVLEKEVNHLEKTSLCFVLAFLFLSYPFLKKPNDLNCISFYNLDKLLPGDEGALRLHLLHYCEACTAPKMPEFILYTFHSAYQKLAWKDLHPDQRLMEAFFKVWPLLVSLP